MNEIVVVARKYFLPFLAAARFHIRIAAVLEVKQQGRATPLDVEQHPQIALRNARLLSLPRVKSATPFSPTSSSICLELLAGQRRSSGTLLCEAVEYETQSRCG